MPFEGTPAIVTGGASGIGLGIVEALAAKGSKVAIWDYNEATLNAEVERLNGEGFTVAGYKVDVSDRANVDEACAAVTADFGAPLILVNNAGVTQWGKFSQMSIEEWDRVMAINLRGTFNCCQVVLKGMQAANWGRIVNISSSSAHSGQPLMSAYVASKAGVIGFTKALALEIGGRGITVNTIPPGLIVTPMMEEQYKQGRFPDSLETYAERTPVRRVGRPSDIANACLFLCSDESSYITGQIIGVNGGRNT